MKFFNTLGETLVILVTLLAFYSTSEANVSILDNGGPGTSSSGTWKISGGANPYGSNSIYSSTGGATYRFSLNLPKPGEYKVFARWTEWRNRRTSVPYDIKHAGGANTVTVNQRKKGGQWNQLGSTWFFDTKATITLRSLGNGTTSADAIKLVPVERVNTPPTFSGTPPTQIVTGNYYSFKPIAYDADGNKLTFTISNRPSWASFNTATGKLSGTPAASNQGFYGNIVISVSDGTNLVSLAAFSIRVDAAVSGARVATDLVAYYPFTEGAGSLVADQSGNGAAMNLTITGSVNWLGGGSGVVMNGGRVGTSGAATKMIDALRLSNTSTFEIWVKPANLTQSGPTRMISLASGTSQQNFMIGQDGSGIEARLMHEGKDVWGKPHLKTGNGVLGSSPIHLVHTYDGAVERLYVNGVQRSETVAIGGAYGNWDVPALFSVGNEASSDRPYAGVIYLAAVYDRALGAAEIQQNFSAGPGNTGNSGGSDPVVSTVPVISGSPAESVLSGNSYSFQPNATDADGDSLAFSISNKPGWASFNTATGKLSGTPAASNQGFYGNVVISVSDGTNLVSLAAFSIRVDVTQTQTGSFTLSWTAPAARSDGTSLSLSEIAGYRIYYGVSPGSYPNSIDVANATQTKVVNNIPVGTYYVVITTRDTGVRESGYSQMITKVAQ